MSGKKQFKKVVRIVEDNKCSASRCVDFVQEDDIAIFSAVRSKNCEVVERCLSSGSDPNARTRIQNVPVVYVACAQGDENVLATLLNGGADPKLGDKYDRSPLYVAASVGSGPCLELLLAAGASPNDRPYVQASTSSDIHDSSSERKDEENNVTGNRFPFAALGLTLPNPGQSCLHQAIKVNSPECVRLLLKAGASSDVSDVSEIPPLLLAGEGINVKETEEVNKYEELVDVLLEHGADPNCIDPQTGETPLHKAAFLCSLKATKKLLENGANASLSSIDRTYNSAIHVAAENSAASVLSEILESERDMFARQAMANRRNHKGCTPLHLAAYSGSHLCVTILLDAGADLGATSNGGISALDTLFLYLPRSAQCLSRVFDARVSSNAATLDERNFALQLDFRPLSPYLDENQTGVLRALMEARSATREITKTLLNHPLVEAFIVLKWRRLRLFFILLVAMYLLFVLSLSTYVILVHSNLDQTPIVEKSTSVSRILLFYSASVVLLNAAGQCAALPKYYLKQFEFWMNIVTGVLSMVVAFRSHEHIVRLEDNKTVPSNLETKGDQSHGLLREDKNCSGKPWYYWEVQITSVTVLLSWVELMLMIGRFPTWGSHALLFYAVLKNVLRVLLALGCLLIGFSLSFYVQFHHANLDAFGDPWKSFVKTVMMMMGEFDYSEPFKDTIPGNAPQGRVIFISFVVLVSIVFVNLMVGLAVSDTQTLKSEGETRRLMKQAEFVTHLDKGVSTAAEWTLLPKSFLGWLSNRRSIHTALTVWPSISSRASSRSDDNSLPRHVVENLVTVALRRKGKFRGASSGFASSAEDTNMLLREIKEILESLDYNNAKTRRTYSCKPLTPSLNVPKTSLKHLGTEVLKAQKFLKRINGKEINVSGEANV